MPSQNNRDLGVQYCLGDLPTELITHIVEFLAPPLVTCEQPYDGEVEVLPGTESLLILQKALHGLCTVSSLMRTIAQPRLFKVVVFQTEKTMPLLLRALVENPACRKWIRSISCEMILTSTTFPENLYHQFNCVFGSDSHLLGLPTLPATILKLKTWPVSHVSAETFTSSLRRFPEALLVGLLSLANDLSVLSLQLPRDHRTDDNNWYGWCEEFLYQELIDFSIKELDGRHGGRGDNKMLCPQLETLLLRGELTLAKDNGRRTASELEFEGFGAHSGVHWPFFSTFPGLQTIVSTCGHWDMGPVKQEFPIPSSIHSPMPVLSVRHLYLRDGFVGVQRLIDVLSMFPSLETLSVTTQPVEFDDLVLADSEQNINDTLLVYGQRLRTLRLSFYNETALEHMIGSGYKLVSLQKLNQLQYLHVQLSMLLSLTELKDYMDTGSGNLRLIDYLPRSLKVFTLDDWIWSDATSSGILQVQPEPHSLEALLRSTVGLQRFRGLIVDSLLTFAMLCREVCPDIQRVAFTTAVPSRWNNPGSTIQDYHFDAVKTVFARKGVSFKAEIVSKNWWGYDQDLDFV